MVRNISDKGARVKSLRRYLGFAAVLIFTLAVASCQVVAGGGGLEGVACRGSGTRGHAGRARAGCQQRLHGQRRRHDYEDVP